MMTCSNCSANLDDVPVGTPCPSCGSGRRDAAVEVVTARMVGRAHGSSRAVGHVVEVDTAQPVTPLGGRMKQVVTSRMFTTTISEPTLGDKDSQSIAVTREGDDVIGLAVGPRDDVLLDSIRDISDALDDNDG